MTTENTPMESPNRVLIVTTASERVLAGFDLTGYACIGVEKGAIYLLNQKIPMCLAVGDFDSISSSAFAQIAAVTQIQVLPTDKDITDTEAAVLEAIKMEYNDIVVISDGRRQDHFMNQLLLTKKYGLTVYCGSNRIRYASSSLTVAKDGYRYISFFAEPSATVSVTGTRWQLQELTLNFLDTFTSSNEIVAEIAEITIHSGGMFIIQSND